MKTLNNMRLKDIFSGLTCFYIDSNDLFAIVKNLNDYERIENEYSNSMKNDDDKKVYKVLLANERFLNKDALMAFIYKNSKDILQKLRSKINMKTSSGREVDESDYIRYSNLQKDVKYLKELLKDIDVVVPSLDLVDTKIAKFTVNCYYTIGPNKRKMEKNKERRAEIEKIIPIEEVLKYQEGSDLLTFYIENDRLSELIRRAIFYNIIAEKEQLSIYGMKEFFFDRNEEQVINEEGRTIPIETVIPYILESIETNALEFVNFDKLLLTSAKRIIDGLKDPQRYDKENDENRKEALKTLNILYDLLKDKNIKIEGYYYIFDTEEEKYIEYSIKDLNNDMSNIVNGIYFTKERLEIVKEGLLEGKLKTSDIPSSVVSKLKISKSDRSIFLKNEANFCDFIERGLIDEKEIHEHLESYETISSDFTLFLYGKGLINENNIIQLYLSSKISIDNIDKISKTIDLHEQVSEKTLVEEYRKYEKGNESNFSKYLLLYKTLILRDKNDKEKDEIGDKIIEEFGETIEDKDFKKFYIEGLIDIDKVIEWNGKGFPYQLIEENNIKPKDLEKLSTIDEDFKDRIINILIGTKLSTEEKFLLINSTFSGKENKNERLELLEYLNFEPTDHDSKNRTKKRDRIEPPVGPIVPIVDKVKRYQYDTSERFKLFELLDKDYSYMLTKDGTLIVNLPNVENGKVLIEKMFKIAKSKNNIDTVNLEYGRATYILDEEEFLNLDGDKIRSKKSISSKDFTTFRKNGATTIPHGKGWTNSMRRYFELELEKDPERAKLIEEQLKLVKESREEID